MNDNQSKAPGPKRPGGGPAKDPRVDAARKRLAESRDQEDALEGLREIVANFLGSEEVGLFRVNRASATFQIFWSFGIDAQKYDLPLALGNAGLKRVMSGEWYVDSGARDHSAAIGGMPAKVQAFVPIRSANQTIAILAILRLLPQKHAFDRADMELFKFLSHEAAQHLFGPRVRTKPAAKDLGMRA